MAATGDADALAVVDAGRDVDLDVAAHRLPALAVAGVARLLGQPPVAAAAVAHRCAHELAERGARDRLELAGPVAARAGDDRRPRLGAIAVAGLAEDARVVGDVDLRAARRVGQRDRDRHGDVAALDRPGTRGATASEGGIEPAGAEERAEQIGDRAFEAAVAAVAAGPWALVAVGVVELPALGVRKHLVRLGRLLELVLGPRVVGVGVRMQLPGEPPEGLLDLGLVGAAADAEHLVVVARQPVIPARRRLRRSARAATPPRARCGWRARSPSASDRSGTPCPGCAGAARSWPRRATACAARAWCSRPRCARRSR